MINRRVLWISIIVLFAMIAADFWRLSLLPDWHYVPAEGPSHSRTTPLSAFFGPILAMLLGIGVNLACNWFMKPDTKESEQSWSHWFGICLAFNTVVAGLAEAFNLARSLGALQSIDRPTLGHFILVVTGILMMLLGNVVPKMPRLSPRFRRFQLDPWQHTRQMRFAGKVLVCSGLLFAVGGPLLPIKMVFPADISLCAAMIGAIYWYRAKIKSEPSPQ